METERKIIRVGNSSAAILIPLSYLKHIKSQIGDTIILKDDFGKHGPFLSFWNKNQKDDNKRGE